LGGASSPLLCIPDDKRRLEIANLQAAFDYVAGFFADDVEGRTACTRMTLLALHRLVVSGLYPCAGELRDAAVRVEVMGASFAPVPAYRLEHELGHMLDHARNWDRDSGIGVRIDLAADTLHRFNAIHPFRGGNGRVSRLLLHLMLYEMRVLSPPEHMFDYIQSRRSAYLHALQSGDAGDLQPIRDFIHRGVIDRNTRTLIERLAAIDRVDLLVASIRRRELRRFLTRPQQHRHLSDRDFHRLAGDLADVIRHVFAVDAAPGNPPTPGPR